MVSVIQKLGPHFSLAKWLLCSTGLYRYLYPTDKELKALSGLQKVNKNRKKHKNGYENGTTEETFHIAKSLEFEVEFWEWLRGLVINFFPDGNCWNNSVEFDSSSFLARVPVVGRFLGLFSNRLSPDGTLLSYNKLQGGNQPLRLVVFFSHRFLSQNPVFVDTTILLRWRNGRKIDGGRNRCDVFPICYDDIDCGRSEPWTWLRNSL